jgi:putative tryptophan/tyrosine transport system substrate-binding protein
MISKSLHRRQGTQAVIVPANGLFRVQRAQLAQLALAARLPTISAERQYVEAGLLASYGVNEGENYRRAAGYIDRRDSPSAPHEHRQRA